MWPWSYSRIATYDSVAHSQLCQLYSSITGYPGRAIKFSTDYSSGFAEDLTPSSIPGRLVIALKGSPVKSRVLLRYSLPTAGRVRILVYNGAGRLVGNWDAGVQRSGDHEFTWDGRDGRGRRVADGIYWIRLLTPDGESVVKAVLLR